MSVTPRPGRIDPTVRALLRTFLSPAVADRYASALQPVAVADRTAAVAGAVTTLLDGFGVREQDVAVALRADVGWDDEDVAALLGMSVQAVLDAAAGTGPPGPAAHVLDPSLLRDAAGGHPVVRGDPPRDGDGQDDAVVPQPVAPPRTVQLATRLSADVAGLPTGLEEIHDPTPRRDDSFRWALVISALLLLVVVVLAAELAEDARVATTSDAVAVELPEPELPVVPTPRNDDGPAVVDRGPALLDEVRFTTRVDPVTGEPGPAVERTPRDGGVRLWGRLDPAPARDTIVDVAFTGPDGSRTVRPVLVPAGLSFFTVRLPAELGGAAGRYLAVVGLGDAEPVRLEVVLDDG